MVPLSLFGSSLSIFGFSLLLSFNAGAAELISPKYSVLQGATSAHETHMTVVVREGENVHFQVRNGAALIPPRTLERVVQPGNVWNVYRMAFDGLEPRIRYDFEILQDGQVRDRRHFQALDTAATSGRVAVLSCMVRQLHNPFMWNALARAENRPNLMLLIGDSVYLDREKNPLFAQPPQTRLEVWEAFANSRNTLNLYFWQDLVPVFSVWDDHDAGGDNVTAKSFPFMPEVRKVYDVFFANEPLPGFLQRGPGLSQQFTLYGKNWILLDDRSFREIEDSSPMWGQEQESWLLDNLRPGANFLVNGVQFFGRFIRKDSLEFDYPDYASEFMRRLKVVGEQREAQIAFVSGDTHFSEVQRIEPEQLGYPTYEITSSSTHSFGFAGHYLLKPPNPRRIEVTGPHNVVLMSFASESIGFSFDVRSLGWRDVTLFQRHVTVGQDCESSLSLP